MESAKPIEPGCMAFTYGMTIPENNWIQVQVLYETGLPEGVEAPTESGRLWKISQQIKVVKPKDPLMMLINPSYNEWDEMMIDICPERFLLRIDDDEQDKSVTKNTDKSIEEAA